MLNMSELQPDSQLTQDDTWRQWRVGRHYDTDVAGHVSLTRGSPPSSRDIDIQRQKGRRRRRVKE